MELRENQTLRMLVVSNTPWRSDNSFGNTYNAFFKGMNCAIANIYCRSGLPDSNAPIDRAYRITERSLLGNRMDPEVPSGEIVEERSDAASVESAVFNAARKRRWQFLFWGRDLIWKLGHWKSSELEAFIDGFNPDIIFLPVYYSNYICNLDLWVIDHCKVPVFSNISDDIYTLKRAELSPLFWIDRFLKRRKIKRVVNSSVTLYVCSDIQRSDYLACFNPPIRILRKGFDFSGVDRCEKKTGICELSFLFTGNVGVGRWESLVDIAKVISEINSQRRKKLSFDIYTSTPLPKHAIAQFGKCVGTVLHEPVSYSEVSRLQDNADVLVHVESFKAKNRKTVRQSISTKIPDYLAKGGCILAYGPSDVASIAYLEQSNSALVATSLDDLRYKIERLSNDPSIIKPLSERAYAFARANHNKAGIQDMLMEDFRFALSNGAKSR